jgi:TolB-like protein/Flp pilus assembly protein TadD
MFTIQLLGGACLRSGDTPLSGPPAQRHRIGLITLIVASWPQPLSRDRAMALLWPERDITSARRLLNLAVHVLRSTLGDEVIASAGDGLLFEASRTSCDLHALRAAIAGADVESVVRLYAGPLLDGFHLDESVEFGYWLDGQRAELAHAYVAALLRLADRQKASGDVHGRVFTHRRLVTTDPLSTVHALALMRALDDAGDRAGAIRHAQEHTARLRAELDLAADPEIQALADRLRSASAESLGAASPLPSVAVLPFLNLGPDPDTEYFADGITEDVIAHLAKMRALRVISSSSVMPFKQRQRSLKQIATTLGATAVIDGSVRRSGDRVRIVAKCIDVETDRHLWVETYDRQLTDIFAIQTDVALHIAAALDAGLSREEENRVCREPTTDLHAYQLFLRGRQRFIEYTPSAVTEAIDFFERAVARDPWFALAHAHIAMAHTALAEHGAVAMGEVYERAAEAADTGLRVDPELGAAHCTVAYLKTVREFDWAGAEASFQRAIELSPSGADAHNLYGRLCAALERYDEAIALLERAEALDPLAHRLDLATTFLRAGRYGEAIARASRAVELDPSHDRANATLGWAHLLSGRASEGLEALERAVSVSQRNTLWLGQLGQAYAMVHGEMKAREILSELESRAEREYVSPYHFAYVHTGLGDADRAIDWLERAVERRTGPAYAIKGSFLFAPLHTNRRFHALLEQMKLA